MDCRKQRIVQRLNGIIKNGTVLQENYITKKQMNKALMAFLIHYIFYRRHGGLRKELNVKTPYQAVEKWFELKPEPNEMSSRIPFNFKI